MPTPMQADRPVWFVLNHISGPVKNAAQKTVERFNAAHDGNLELFAPTYVVKEERRGELRLRTVNLTFHYVFVRGAFADVKLLCSQQNGFSFLIDRGNERRYATIDDHRMVQFQNIARAYKNCLPFFSLDDIDLEDGDVVEVVRGDFPGLVGTYIPNPRSKTGNIVLHVYNKVGTMAFNVKASDVRVLEFSRNSTRANDQMDAFTPHLLAALRHFEADEPIPTPLLARMAVFCGRMEVAELRNRKLDARLQLLLYAAATLTGNPGVAAKARERYESVKDALTNEWTLALADLVLGVLAKDKELLRATGVKVAEMNATSKTQRMVKEELSWYSSKPET